MGWFSEFSIFITLYALLLVACKLQLFHLKTFFEKKKAYLRKTLIKLRNFSYNFFKTPLRNKIESKFLSDGMIIYI